MSCFKFANASALTCLLVITMPSAALAAAALDNSGPCTPAAGVQTSPADDLLTPAQRDFLLRLRQIPPELRTNATLCLAPGTPQHYIDELNEIMFPEGEPRYEQTARWPGNQGDPIALTYSFVPDGVSVPANAGLPGGTNQMFTVFNNLFGSPAAWQTFWIQSFDAWESLTGITYTLVSDDGAPLFGSAGSADRGDLRISAINLDGANGVLAYNNFPMPGLSGNPGGGDMVLDSADGGNWGSPTNNHRFLRNTIMHEHGHGMGLLHVCPDNGSKLMEPFINTGFDGPQHDDVRSSQRHYGDIYEPNDSSAAPTEFGAVGGGQVSVTNLSIDDNADMDFFAFTVSPGAIVSAMVTPVGLSYQTGPQGLFGCFFSSPTTVNSLTVHNLELALIDMDGTSVLLSASSNPAGQAESFTDFALGGSGTYFLRVQPTTPTNDIQIYNLQFAVEEPLGGDGDFDNDGDWDLADFQSFQICLGPLQPGCEDGDMNADDKVDLIDYTSFHAILAGP
jgi:hypothetical protein